LSKSEVVRISTTKIVKLNTGIKFSQKNQNI